MLGQAAQRQSAGVVLQHLALPEGARGLRIARQCCQLAAGRHDQANVGILRAQAANALLHVAALALQCLVHIAQPRLVVLRPVQIGLHHLLLLGRGQQTRLQIRDFADLLAVHHHRNRTPQLFVGQPGDRNQKREQQHHILGHLGPGDGAHAAQKRAQQHAAKPQHDADLELHARQARGNQADAVDLRDHIGRRAHHSRQRRNDARPGAPKADMKKIGHGVEPHGPQVRCHQNGHQTKAPRPAQQIGQAAGLLGRARIALEVERAGEADEGGRAHPVGRRSHAVVHGRDAPARHVVLQRIGGAAIHPDGGVDHHRQK